MVLDHTYGPCPATHPLAWVGSPSHPLHVVACRAQVRSSRVCFAAGSPRPFAEHLIIAPEVSGMSVSIRQVGALVSRQFADILLAIAQWIIVRDLRGRAS